MKHEQNDRGREHEKKKWRIETRWEGKEWIKVTKQRIESMNNHMYKSCLEE